MVSYRVLPEWLGINNNIRKATVTTVDQVRPSTWGTFCRFALELTEPAFEDTMFLLGNFDTCCQTEVECCCGASHQWMGQVASLPFQPYASIGEDC